MSNPSPSPSSLKSPGAEQVAERLAGLPASPASGQAEIRYAAASERSEALRMVLGNEGLDADDERVADFLRLCVLRKIDYSQLTLAKRGGRLLWAILPLYSPGNTVLLLAPSRVDPDDTAAAAELIAWLLAQRPGLVLAQSLIDPNQPLLAEPFFRAGFSKLATLHYLQRMMRSAPPPPAPHAPAFRAHTYSAETHALFRAALARSYEGSLDCPAIDGMRNLDDILAGHKVAGGEFDPALWTVLTENGEPAAVLLLGPPGGAGDNAMELVYLGVSPGYRGKSLGRHLLRHALHTAWTHHCVQLTLAVDADNAPALRLYHSAGFARVHLRLALMRDLRNTTAERLTRLEATSVTSQDSQSPRVK